MVMSAKERVRKHRQGLLSEGMRPIQIWVPDTRRAGFAEECRRQSRLLHQDPLERATLEFIGEASDTEGWE